MEQMDFEKDIEASLQVLRKGGLILYPTDTVWGIGCDATLPEAVAKIFELKKRVAAKSMIVLIADMRDINHYTARPEPYIADYLAKTDRPTTVIYESALGLAENLVGEDGTIAMRVVKDDFCRHLIKRFRKPLVSTSANISGEVTPSVFQEIGESILKGVDYVVRYRRNDVQPAKPSSLIRFSKLGEPIVLRS